MEVIEKTSEKSLEDFNNLESVSFLLVFIASIYFGVMSGFNPVFIVLALISFIMVFSLSD